MFRRTFHARRALHPKGIFHSANVERGTGAPHDGMGGATFCVGRRLLIARGARRFGQSPGSARFGFGRGERRTATGRPYGVVFIFNIVEAIINRPGFGSLGNCSVRRGLDLDVRNGRRPQAAPTVLHIPARFDIYPPKSPLRKKPQELDCSCGFGINILFCCEVDVFICPVLRGYIVEFFFFDHYTAYICTDNPVN